MNPKVGDYVRTLNGIGEVISIVPTHRYPETLQKDRLLVHHFQFNDSSLVNIANILEILDKKDYPEYQL